MKNFKMILFSFGLYLVIAISCEKENLKSPCIEGIVFGYGQCEEASLIEVKNLPNLGRTIPFYDFDKGDTVYNNVIKVPGSFPVGKIYFNYRKYNRSADYVLFLFDSPQACPFDNIPYDVPIYVITNYSQTSCP
jgi:hypothetical protein